MSLEKVRVIAPAGQVLAGYPAGDRLIGVQKTVSETERVLSGYDRRLLVIAGPCSADSPAAVLDYCLRLAAVAERTKERLLIIPRIFTAKPRTAGTGYMGLLHSMGSIDEAIVTMRKLHLAVLDETGFSAAFDVLYPEILAYVQDIIAYAVVGARSVENQQHRFLASGLDIPVGMKNPLSGSVTAMLNGVSAAQRGHRFIYDGYECESTGNAFAHCILRGYTDRKGRSRMNCRTQDLRAAAEAYFARELRHPAIIVDVNHGNSGKRFDLQPDIAMDVIDSMKSDGDVRAAVRGFMIESYIEDGSQPPGGGVYGKSVTDGCLGFAKTEALMYRLAEAL